MTTAFLLSMIMNFGSYWFSDKIVLSLHGASDATKSHPDFVALVRRLSQHAKLAMPKVYVYDSKEPNAFATGRDEQHAAVAASTGLLRLMDEKELAGVMAHELAHIKNRDMLVSSIAATLGGAISMVGEMMYGFGAMFLPRSQDDDAPNPLLGILFALIAPLAAMLIQFAVSRSREYLADETGAKIAGSPFGLASALLKLNDYAKHARLAPSPQQASMAHLYIHNNFTKGNFISLFSTHPPVEDRVKRLKALATV